MGPRGRQGSAMPLQESFLSLGIACSFSCVCDSNKEKERRTNCEHSYFHHEVLSLINEWKETLEREHDGKRDDRKVGP